MTNEQDFDDNQVRLQLFAMAYNVSNFLLRLALPKSISDVSLRTMREKCPQQREIPVKKAEFAWFAERTALVEMTAASGLDLLKPEQFNPLKTTTYSTGQLIRAAPY